MKKFVSMLLALVMVFALCACGSKTEDGNKDAASIKVGFICLHDENSTYDKNFIDAAKAACKNAGLSEDQYIIKTNIPEGQECYNAAAELVDAGCNVVFADSFGHEDFMIQAAKDFPKVQFCHATGTKAHTEKLSNYHNAFASIYEGRYLAGVAAGMKLNEMIEAGKFTADEAKMGYVGAFTYAEVISGYTSFYLGAKSVCPTVTMDVTKAIKDIKGGKVDFRVDKNGNLSFLFGKLSFSAEALDQNFRAVADEVKRLKPATVKGRCITKATISSTMNPGIPVDPASI